MGKHENLIGQKFGRLLVIDEAGIEGRGKYRWLCWCECGKETVVRGDLLKSGRTKSCGCLSSDSAKYHLVGNRYGHLSVIREEGRNKHGEVMWLCKCDCGNEMLAKSCNLVHGFVKSCGCMSGQMISNANKKHGKINTRIYSSWHCMKNRCYNTNDEHYPDYGARGITVCEEWKDNFQVFYEWAISHGFREDLTIDRIDVNKGYSPNNCRWATAKEQQRNRRITVYLDYKGDKKPLAEWAEIKGIDRKNLEYRIRAKWPVEKALETPVKSKRKG